MNQHLCNVSHSTHVSQYSGRVFHAQRPNAPYNLCERPCPTSQLHTHNSIIIFLLSLLLLFITIVQLGYLKRPSRASFFKKKREQDTFRHMKGVLCLHCGIATDTVNRPFQPYLMHALQGAVKTKNVFYRRKQVKRYISGRFKLNI